MEIASQITFLYYPDLEPPSRLFEDVLGLEKADDQGFAKIYRVSGNAFIGIVDEQQGYGNAPLENNTLVTMVVNDVQPWYEHLQRAGVKITRAPKFQSKANVECFFFEDSGGYAFEVQRFLDPDTAEKFGQT